MLQVTGSYFAVATRNVLPCRPSNRFAQLTRDYSAVRRDCHNRRPYSQLMRSIGIRADQPRYSYGANLYPPCQTAPFAAAYLFQAVNPF